jgi:hypothetical protein
MEKSAVQSQEDEQPVPDIDIALLIDGDNARAALIEPIIKEAQRYGRVTIRRIYGDWTEENMKPWRQVLHVHAIQPFQQFRVTVGKNITDSSLIIDAMDILHSKLVGGFCIVSSDGDYTRLATRIRESGVIVMGIGEAHTPEPFRNACEVFIYVENIAPEHFKKPVPTTNEAKLATIEKKAPRELETLLIDAYHMVEREGGWAYIADIGTALRKIDPGFDPRTYGASKIFNLIGKYPKRFELKNKTPTIVYVKLKS